MRKRAIKRWWFYDIPLMIYNLLIVCFWGWDRVMSFLEASVCVIQLIQWGLPDTHEIKGGRQTAVSQQERWIVQWITSKGMRMSWVIIIKAQLGLLDLYFKKRLCLLKGSPICWCWWEKGQHAAVERVFPLGSPNREGMKFPSTTGKCIQSRDKRAEGLPYKLVITACLNEAKGLFAWHHWLSNRHPTI